MNIAVIGAGGHTRSLLNLLQNKFGECQISIFDDGYISEGEKIGDYVLVGRLDNIKPDARVIISIGSVVKRANYFDRFKPQLIFENLIHDLACLEQYVVLGDCNQIFANAYINSFAKIGSNNIINTSAILEHEVSIGDHNHIAVGAVLCGRVNLGSRCFIGAGATVIDKIVIGNDVTVGAGAVVVSDIDQPGVYVGVPARRLK